MVNLPAGIKTRSRLMLFPRETDTSLGCFTSCANTENAPAQVKKKQKPINLFMFHH